MKSLNYHFVNKISLENQYLEPASSEDVGLCSLLLWQYKPHGVIYFGAENYPPEPDWVKGRKAVNLSEQ